MNIQSLEFISAMNKFSISTEPSPLQEIIYQGQKLLLKRDDLLQLGCSKQRSIPYMIYLYLLKQEKRFIVSGSGNSGLVSAYCALNCREIEEMQICFAKTISDVKLQRFIDKLKLNYTPSDFRKGDIHLNNIIVKLVEDPRQEAFNLSKLGYINLRGSTDDNAILGFKSIADEIFTQTETKISSLFVPASSGTTAIGIYEGFLAHSLNPKMNIVQTTKINTLIRNITKSTISEDSHPSESIVDYIGHRRPQIEKIITESKGNAWVISSQEVQDAKEILQNQYGINTSFDSALSFAGYIKSNRNENALLIFTG